MSPSSREPMRAALSPDRVSLVRLGRRRRLLEGKVVECAAPEPGEPAWAPAVRAFREGLSGMQGRPSGVTVVLSNHFARYTLVPWRGQLNGAEEEIAHARHCFEQVYGGMAAAWEIRLSPGAEGEPRVACAVDSGLLSGLDQTMTAAGIPLRSVQPYLMTAFNHWRNELDGPLVWFLVAEAGRVCLSTLRNGRWAELHNQYAGPGWTAALPAQLARQRLLSDLPAEGRVCVFAPEDAAERVLQQSGEVVRSLRLPAPDGVAAQHAASLAMALCG